MAEHHNVLIQELLHNLVLLLDDINGHIDGDEWVGQ